MRGSKTASSLAFANAVNMCGKAKKRNIRDYLVKWAGDDKPTWEPESNLVGIEVFETYKKQKVA